MPRRKSLVLAPRETRGTACHAGPQKENEVLNRLEKGSKQQFRQEHCWGLLREDKGEQGAAKTGSYALKCSLLLACSPSWGDGPGAF